MVEPPSFPGLRPWLSVTHKKAAPDDRGPLLMHSPAGGQHLLDRFSRGVYFFAAPSPVYAGLGLVASGVLQHSRGDAFCEPVNYNATISKYLDIVNV